MFVANRMTAHPVTATPNTSWNEAMALMKKHRCRRLPVVERGKLVGFLSDQDLMRAAPSSATTLSRFEIQGLLDKLAVKDIMQKDVITVSDDATIEEAALIMYNNRIGGLPVVSEVGVVVGVITETDIFKTFVDVMGLVDGKTRLTIEVADKVGVVKDIASVFTENGLNIDSLITCKQAPGSYEIVVRGDIPASEEESIREQIEAKGYRVVHIARIG